MAGIVATVLKLDRPILPYQRVPDPSLSWDDKIKKWILASARMDGAWIAAYSLHITQITTQNKYYTCNDNEAPWDNLLSATQLDVLLF